MVKLVTIPNVGEVEFPDEMSNEQITQAIEQDILGGANKFANSAPVNAVLGFGNAVGNQLANIWNKLPGAPQMNPIKSGAGTAYNIGHAFGGIAPYFALPEANLGTFRRGIELIPIGGKMLASALGRALPQVGYAAATSENPLEEAKTMGLLQAGFEGLPVAAKGVGKLFKFMKPGEHAENILNNLGGNVASTEENAKLLAKSIKDAYTQAQEKGSAYYRSVFNHPSILQASPRLDKVLVQERLTKSFDRDLMDLNKAYLDNPSLEKAHELQSQLGTSIRQLQRADTKGNLSIADRKVMQDYKKAKTAVDQKIYTALSDIDKTKGTDLSNQYSFARRNWSENVVPYLENPKISQIAKGKIKNPRNLSTLFKNPEDYMDKIVSDIGQTGANRILYNELSKSSAVRDPESLLKSYQKLENKGLKSYANPALESEMAALESKIQKKKTLKALTSTALGVMGGNLLSKALGSPILRELGGIAGYQNPAITDPVISLAQALGKAYRPVGKAGIAYSQTQ